MVRLEFARSCAAECPTRPASCSMQYFAVRTDLASFTPCRIWGMLRGKEGWFDPLNLRQLNEHEVKDYEKAKEERKAKHAQASKTVSIFPATAQVKPAASGKVVSAAGGKAPKAPGTPEASGPRISQLFTSSPSAEDSLAWDPSASSPTSEAGNGTTRPDVNAAVNVTVKTMADARRKALAFDNRKEHVGDASKLTKPATSNAVKETPADTSSGAKPEAQPDDAELEAQPDDVEPEAQPVEDTAVEDTAVEDTVVEFAANHNGTAGVIDDAAALDLTALDLVTDGMAEGIPTSEVGSTKPPTARPKHMQPPLLGQPQHQGSPIDPTVAKQFYEMFQ